MKDETISRRKRKAYSAIKYLHSCESQVVNTASITEKYGKIWLFPCFRHMPQLRDYFIFSTKDHHNMRRRTIQARCPDMHRVLRIVIMRHIQKPLFYSASGVNASSTSAGEWGWSVAEVAAGSRSVNK